MGIWICEVMGRAPSPPQKKAEPTICMGICICEVMGRAPPPKKKAEPTPWGSLFAAMSSSASDTFSLSAASAIGSANSASPPIDFPDMEEINVDAVPVEERPD